MAPVPETKSLTFRSVALEIGVVTEYTAEDGNTIITVYITMQEVCSSFRRFDH